MTYVPAAPALPSWANSLVRGPADLRRLVVTVRRYWLVFLGVLGAVMAADIVYTFTRTPLYTANASVMIDTRQRSVSDVKEVVSDLAPQTAVVDTEVELIRSRALAGRVVDTLNLTRDPEFNRALRPGLFGGQPQPATTPEAQRRHREATINAVINRLKVQRRGLTFVIDISFTSANAEKASRIATTYADRYLTAQLDAKVEATARANRWLAEQVDQLGGQVQQSEQAVAQYQAQSGLLTATGSQLTEQRVSQLLAAESQASADLAEQQARLATARQQMARGGGGEDIGEAIANDVVKQLRVQLSEEQRRQQELLQRYGPQHPEVLKSRETQNQIRANIQGEVQRVVSSLQANANAAQQRLAAIQNELGRARGELARGKSAEVGLNQLQRSASASSTLYQSFLERLQETSSQQGSLQSDAQLVAPAQLPLSPSSPKEALNLAVGLVLGLLLATASVVGMEMWSGEVRTSEDVERMLGAPAMGSVPTTRTESATPPAQFLIDKPLSAFAESFRGLRAALGRADLDREIQVLAVTSSVPAEGKSTTSLCLARSSALAGQRTIVVDCDVRRRGLEEILHARPTVGLLEVLSGEAPLESALLLDEPSGAMILPVVGAQFTPREIFNTKAFADLLQALRERFDMVILDCAPALAVADTRVIAKQADAVLFLLRWQKTPARAARLAMDALTSVGARIAGVALTQVNLRSQAAYGYGDSGYYYREYAKYYSN
ncbi:GumC family protein [Phenylobacterium sp.]|uniref:GumC family protein n=1 Tax=Phenylobacterium sp. TaxID=1871053 RepID=UPI0035B0677B